MSAAPFTRAELWTAAGLGTAFLAIFLTVSHNVFFGAVLDVHVVGLDTSILTFHVHARQRWLTQLALAVTTLGSPQFLGAFVAAMFIALGLARDAFGVILQGASGLGALVWTPSLKGLIARPRPPLEEHLVQVESFSYPSGHALASAAVLMGGALVACRHIRSRNRRFMVLGATGAIATMIALSRVYLGVHYPSDAAAGTSFGLAWAFLCTAALGWVERRRPLNE